MKNWPTTVLSSVCLEITVGHVGKMSDQYVEAGVPFLRSQDIEPGFVRTEGLKYVSEQFHQRLKKSQLRPGDVVVVRTGYPGTAAVIPETLPIANCADLVIVRPGANLNARFLTFLLNSPWGRGQVAGRLVGVAQQHFNVKVAQALQIPFPPLDVQRRIASILGSYDDLINVNRQRIDLLENMARRLFEEWFVRFRHPGHESHEMIDTPTGRKPAEWSNGVLGDLIGLAYGRALRTDTRVPGNVPVIGSSGVVGWHDEPLVEGPGIVVGRKGNVGAIVWCPTDFFPIDTVFYVETERPLLFVLQQLRRLTFLNSDAAVPGLNRGSALAMPILLPPLELMTLYQARVEEMFALIESLRRANQKLSAARDLLLPGILSGAVSIARRELKAVA